MSTSFSHHVRKLRALVQHFDASSNAYKLVVLQRISECDLMPTRSLIAYGELLLFLQAYPPDRALFNAAKRERSRVSRWLARSGNGSRKALENSALPHTSSVSTFSIDQIKWLLNERGCHIGIERFENTEFDLNQVLAATLPTLERHETTAGSDNMELIDSLTGGRVDPLRFLVAELDRSSAGPLVKDLLFDGLGLYVRITPRNRTFSKAYNALPIPRPFFHNEILKRFEAATLLDEPLPSPTPLTARELQRTIRVVKLSMVLTDRETDPVTYLDERSFRYYSLGRGISIANYGMLPTRQLALESYIGYTLFKNGIPAAYGGAWVFGRRADIGINIFEAFRGGESGYLLCQVLRVYRQVFKISCFEVEPYQFGLDNPDGIATGAFWFYHKYGFRPTDPKLLALSEAEVKKRMARKGYRTSARVLERFTQGNLVLAMDHREHPGVYALAGLVKELILTRYKGDRTRAIAESTRNFRTRTGMRKGANADGEHVLQEVALWAEATNEKEPTRLDLMVQMIRTKPSDLYRYQQLLLRYFEGT